MAVEPPASSPGSIPPAMLALLGGLVFILVAGYVTLAIAGRDTTGYVLFTAGGVFPAIVTWILSHKVKAVQDLAQLAVDQTNGQLSAQFVDVHEHLDGQTGILLAGLEPNPPAPAPLRAADGRPYSSRAALPMPLVFFRVCWPQHPASSP